jgi:acetyl esterase/lipase
VSHGAVRGTRRSRRLFVVLLLLIAAVGWSYSWTYTPHGRLDYRAALSLRLPTVPWAVRPDPGSDFELPLRLNLVFVLSMLLPQEEVSRVEDVAILAAVEVPARVYWPATTKGAAVPLPVIVHLHGGGFVLGNVDQFDAVARSLANAASAVLVSRPHWS